MAKKVPARGDDPLNCQTKPQLRYLAFFEDADRRAAAGEVQEFCATCKRYRWPDAHCAQFVGGAGPCLEEATA